MAEEHLLGTSGPEAQGLDPAQSLLHQLHTYTKSYEISDSEPYARSAKTYAGQTFGVSNFGMFLIEIS